MDINDILALTKAGFTKDEIMQLASFAEAPKEEPKETPEAAPEQPKAEEPKEAPASDPRLDDVISKIEKLSSGLETLALKSTELPKRETAEEALAKIINPYISTTGTGGLSNGSK